MFAKIKTENRETNGSPGIFVIMPKQMRKHFGQNDEMFVAKISSRR